MSCCVLRFFRCISLVRHFVALSDKNHDVTSLYVEHKSDLQLLGIFDHILPSNVNFPEIANQLFIITISNISSNPNLMTCFFQQKKKGQFEKESSFPTIMFEGLC